MNVADAIDTVMARLNETLEHIDDMDQELSVYSEQMQIMNIALEEIEATNMLMTVQAKNQAALNSDLVDLLRKLTLPAGSVEALSKPKFISSEGIRVATQVRNDFVCLCGQQTE